MIRTEAQLIAKTFSFETLTTLIAGRTESGARNGAAIITIVVATGFLVSSEDHG